MVRIVSRKSVGTQAVYDIGVSKDHNFLLANGLVASNCFNKSHSTAYGYVTYQTAYLKANYPVEYMAALLTANSGDQAKVQRYIATCISMGIQVEPPDINRSGVDFTPLEASILFGLSAVRHVGQGAIEEILAARESEGKFQSLADLCDRVDSRIVNRRALEALIHCGALDSLEKNRNQLMHDLDPVMAWAQGRAKDRAMGQGNLFDLFGSSTTQTPSTFESAPKVAAVADFPQNEKLRLEKELLGFYISDHPLKAVQQSAQILAPVNLLELEDQPENTLVSAIVLLTEVKPIVTKKGDRMAIVQLEDLTGKAEAVVFPKSYERINACIAPDRRLMVWGKIDRRDDRVQLILEDAEPIEEVRLVMVELTPHKAADIEEQYRLKTVLLEQGGEGDAKVPVVAAINSQHQRSFVRLGARFRVENDQTTVQALVKAGFQARAASLAAP